MRWAVLADIHGNLEALEAVLAVLSNQDIDGYLCLGDIVGYGADTSECIQRIRAINPVTVAGNHDWAAAQLLEIDFFNPLAQAGILWTRQNISSADKAYLRGRQLVYAQAEFTLVHGSLENSREFNYITDSHSAEKTFQILGTQICFIGHSHRPTIFVKQDANLNHLGQTRVNLKPGASYIVNAGSLGQPRDGNPQATYVIYDDQQQLVEIKREAYDVHRAQEKIIRAGLPQFLALRLSTGN